MLEKYGFENIYYFKCQKISIIFQKTYRVQWLLLIITKGQLNTPVKHGLLTLNTKKFVGNIFYRCFDTELLQIGIVRTIKKRTNGNSHVHQRIRTTSIQSERALHRLRGRRAHAHAVRILKKPALF